MNTSYNPKEIEEQFRKQWEENNCFSVDENSKKPAYCIMLPPPNVTGSLHMGHAFQHTLMDVLTRYHRARGYNVLWQPGTDHAGIATQMVVERLLSAQGIKPADIGRDAFIEKVWEWKAHSGGIITEQMRCLGNSMAWDRERFTMDEPLSQATQTAFLRLHEDGLIYRGQRLVNWDTHFQSAVSDLEVVNKKEKGKLYNIQYTLTQPTSTVRCVVVSTTRPETLFGDVALAVHPKDKRFSGLIGQTVCIPLTNQTIPIVEDEYVDPEFGTGCVKITPGHDFNDYQVGVRHKLPLVNILNFNGTLNESVPEAYQGVDRLKARPLIVSDLEKTGALVGTKNHNMTRPYGDRSNTVIEPMLTWQWFVRAKPLAEKALSVVREKNLEFIPSGWENTYFQWLENIEDWCISRQIWWGHRIPAWYDEHNNAFVARNAQEAQQKAQAHHATNQTVVLTQDADVLDTWFSSALWPFSTLGWPEKTAALKTWYPTSTLVTGFDIIFFWVARMVMMGLYFCGDVPFKHVYITGLIRDHRGQKMSKSKGNVIDPLDVVRGISLNDLLKKRTHGLMQEHLKKSVQQNTQQDYPNGIEGFGVDALRFTLMAQASTSRDINFGLNQIRGYRNFCNKIWNAARFVELQVRYQPIDKPSETRTLNLEHYGVFEQWILQRLECIIRSSQAHIESYRFDRLSEQLYSFVWHEFCDWYIEIFKIQSDAEGAPKRRFVILYVLDVIMRVLHPIIPFLTESIWQSIKPLVGHQHAFLATFPWPTLTLTGSSDNALSRLSFLQDVVKEVRRLRADFEVAVSARIPAIFITRNSWITPTETTVIATLARVDRILEVESNQGRWIRTGFGGILLDEQWDVAGRLKKIQILIESKQTYIEQKAKKLNNTVLAKQAPEVFRRFEMEHKNAKTDLEQLSMQKAALESIGAV